MRAMVHYMDHAIGQVVGAAKELGLWDNMVVVVHSDNGGEIIFEGTCGGNNWPLRGGKFSNFEVTSGGREEREREREGEEERRGEESSAPR